MNKIIPRPDYLELWTSNNDFALFLMWKKESRLWKILERDGEELIKADARILINNSTVIEFVKRYQEPKRDLLRGELIILGQDIELDFIRVFGAEKILEEKKQRGDFVLLMLRNIVL